MKVLGLDIATRLGWAALVYPDAEMVTQDQVQLDRYGSIGLTKPIKDLDVYPWSYMAACRDLANKVTTLIEQIQPNVVVIEEINIAKARFSQKILDMLHYSILERLEPGRLASPVFYLSSGEWRRGIGLMVSKEDKKKNRKLSQAKSKAKALGVKLDKKALGIAGKKNIKHASVEFVNARFGLKLLKKNDDEADAILCALAHAIGIRTEYMTGED